MKATPTIIRATAAGVLYYLFSTVNPAKGQPPVRDPHTAGYVPAVELKDGAVPAADTNGNSSSALRMMLRRSLLYRLVCRRAPYIVLPLTLRIVKFIQVLRVSPIRLVRRTRQTPLS